MVDSLHSDSVRTDGPAFDAWQRRVTASRHRATHLLEGRTLESILAYSELETLRELTLTYEELAVAEEELRVQNDELVRAVDVISSERRRYRDLFFSASVPYLVTDIHGTIVEVNQAASELLQRRGDHLVGKPCVVFSHNVSRRRIRRGILKAMSVGRARFPVKLALESTSKIIPVEAIVVAGADARGRLDELRWVLVDQRPRRRAEQRRKDKAAQLEKMVAERTAELERAQQLKDMMVATVSHELRTPLAAIGGYVDLLQMGLRGPLNAAQLADLQRIQRAYEHLTHIVEDLLSHHRLASGQLSFEMQAIRVEDAMASVGELVAPQAAEREIRFAVEPVETSLVIRADAERVKQILVNLLGNAVKFTPSGGAVWLRARADGDMALVEVEDTGSGIPEHELESIFQPFARLVSANVPGTGLGLAISRDMARAMGGDLTVTSIVGNGSTFTLRFPSASRET